MAATATSCQTTILYVAFVGIFLLTDAHSIPVPEPEYSPSPVSATVDTLVHGVDQCLQVGTTYDQIDEFKQSVCQSKDDYLRVSGDHMYLGPSEVNRFTCIWVHVEIDGADLGKNNRQELP